MESLTFSTVPVLVGLVLCGCLVVWRASSGGLEPPGLSKERVALLVLWLALAFLLWISDYPISWRLPEIVEYLAEVTLSAFRILVVTATGTVLFGLVVALLLLTRPKGR